MAAKKKKAKDDEFPEVPEKPLLNIPAKYIGTGYPGFVHNGKDCVIVEKEQLTWWVVFEGDPGKYMMLPEELKVLK